jgi:toxin ParE1/3/4
MRVVWTATALSGLNSAHDCIAEESPGAAAALIKRIETAVQAVRRHPQIGKQGRVEGTREFVVTGTPLIVVYIVAAGRIEVAALIHGARRWPE